MGTLQNAVYIIDNLKKSLENIVINKNEEVLISIDKNATKNLLLFFKMHTNLQFKLLLDIYAVDYPKRKRRFELNYMLLSIVFNYRAFLKTNSFQDEIVESITSIFNSANWLEREVWDMFGIFFNNHKDLRRILTDYGFEGFPLRKDFPLTGYLQFKYDDESQTVVTEPVELTQEFRSFEYTMPWTEKE